jgi:hypothetical protein
MFFVADVHAAFVAGDVMKRQTPHARQAETTDVWKTAADLNVGSQLRFAFRIRF